MGEQDNTLMLDLLYKSHIKVNDNTFIVESQSEDKVGQFGILNMQTSECSDFKYIEPSELEKCYMLLNVTNDIKDNTDIITICSKSNNKHISVNITHEEDGNRYCVPCNIFEIYNGKYIVIAFDNDNSKWKKIDEPGLYNPTNNIIIIDAEKAEIFKDLGIEDCELSIVDTNYPLCFYEDDKFFGIEADLSIREVEELVHKYYGEFKISNSKGDSHKTTKRYNIGKTKMCKLNCFGHKYSDNLLDIIKE